MIALVQRHAERSDHLHHHCALVVKHGRILSIGVNRNSNHAEEDAIGSLSSRVKGATLYSFRVKGNRLLLAKPCQHRFDGRPSCEELIRRAGIKWVIYSTSTGEMKRSRV